MIETSFTPVDVLIPQMGEGIREVTIVSLTKQPGDRVERDEVLYEMETDKAALEIESPEAGILDEWYVRPGEIIRVGAPVARLLSASNGNGKAKEISASTHISDQDLPRFDFRPSAESVTKPTSNIRIPPRTIAYCRSKSITDEEMRSIPAARATLDIADVDRYLASLNVPQEIAIVERAPFEDIPLSDRQTSLNLHLERSFRTVVSASISAHLDWDFLEKRTHELRHSAQIASLTEFQLLSFCISRAVAKHPKFRSTLINGNIRRQYMHINLGFAVAMPDDDLLTAVVRDADTLSLSQFARSVMRQLRLARRGTDQAASDTHLTVSYLASHGVVDAMPVLVLPSAATLFIGAPYELASGRVSNLVIAFDHRSINGVGAANFLNEIKSTLVSITA